jgi:hypothetical protein
MWEGTFVGGKPSNIDAMSPGGVAEWFVDAAKQFYNRAEYFGVDTMPGDNDTESFYFDAEWSGDCTKQFNDCTKQSGDHTEWFDDRTKQYSDYTE